MVKPELSALPVVKKTCDSGPKRWLNPSLPRSGKLSFFRWWSDNARDDDGRQLLPDTPANEPLKLSRRSGCAHQTHPNHAAEDRLSKS